MKRIGLGALAVCVLGALGAVLGKNFLVVNYGIQFFRMVRGAFVGAGALSLCVAGAGGVREWRFRREQARLAAPPVVEAIPMLSYDADRYDPAEIRQMLHNLIARRPDLPMLATCIAQMDAMDKRQAELQKLIDVNGAAFLSSTTDALDEVEQYICKNMRRVINRGFVSAEPGSQSDGEFVSLVGGVLKRNQEQLDSTKDFLNRLADYLSEKNTGAEYVNFTLEAWKKAFHDSIMKPEDGFGGTKKGEV
ncbi:MAG: hypothetical protein LBR77_06640 [Lachnospiraceae bacterium]|nr:hypothetical protein [Lachnospiraceae bacterium]